MISSKPYRQIRKFVRHRRWTIAKVRPPAIRDRKFLRSEISLLNLPDDVLGVIFKQLLNGFIPHCVRDVLALAGACRRLRYIAQQFLDVVNLSNRSVFVDGKKNVRPLSDIELGRVKSLLRLVSNTLRKVSLGVHMTGIFGSALLSGKPKFCEVSLIDNGELTQAEILNLLQASHLRSIDISHPKLTFINVLKETFPHPKHISLHDLRPYQFNQLRGITTEGINRLEVNFPPVVYNAFNPPSMTYIDLISDTPFAPEESRVSDAFQKSTAWYLRQRCPFAITRQPNDLVCHACDELKMNTTTRPYQTPSYCSALTFPTLNFTGYLGARADLRILLSERDELAERLRWNAPPLAVGWYAIVNSFGRSIRVDLPSRSAKLIQVPISTLLKDISSTNTYPHIIHVTCPVRRVNFKAMEAFLRACTVPEMTASLRAIHVGPIPKISPSFAQILTRLLKLTTSIHLLDIHTSFIEELWTSAHGEGHCVIKAGGANFRTIHIRSSNPFPERLNFLITLPRFLASVDRCCRNITTLDLHCRSSPMIQPLSRRRWQKSLDEALTAFEDFAVAHSNVNIASFRKSLELWSNAVVPLNFHP